MIGNTEVATATEIQNNFGRYLAILQDGIEIIVTRNGKEVGRFIPKDAAISYLTDSLTGIMSSNTDMMIEKEERLISKYANSD